MPALAAGVPANRVRDPRRCTNATGDLPVHTAIRSCRSHRRLLTLLTPTLDLLTCFGRSEPSHYHTGGVIPLRVLAARALNARLLRQVQAALLSSEGCCGSAAGSSSRPGDAAKAAADDKVDARRCSELDCDANSTASSYERGCSLPQQKLAPPAAAAAVIERTGANSVTLRSPEGSLHRGNAYPGSLPAAAATAAAAAAAGTTAASAVVALAAAAETSPPVVDSDVCGVCLDPADPAPGGGTRQMLAVSGCGHPLCAGCARQLVSLRPSKPSHCPLCRGIIAELGPARKTIFIAST